jgi:hypothetical protein
MPRRNSPMVLGPFEDRSPCRLWSCACSQSVEVHPWFSGAFGHPLSTTSCGANSRPRHLAAVDPGYGSAPTRASNSLEIWQI